MKRIFKGLLTSLFVFTLLAAPAYYLLVAHSPSLKTANYSLNLAEIRTAANQIPGPKPTQIRFERVADFEFSKAMIVAGDPWEGTDIPIISYQLVFPDRTIIVDTAMAETKGIPDFMVQSYDLAAYTRMSKAMEQADKIVITHEHSDHIGGILAHPKLKGLLPAITLTQEQLGHPDRMAPLTLPPGIFDDYKALVYERFYPLAPGVVLIKAPGHTPGSQMVFIQLADGREVLLLGDVAWQYRSIDLQRERPLFMTALIKENRQEVLAQFHSLAELAGANPALQIMPGHDAKVLNTLVEERILLPGFL